MIEWKHEDLLKADAEALVNTVNCVGVMGRGIALQFRKAFPENYKSYKALCDRKKLRPGVVFVHAESGLLNPRYVINFPTKDHWKSPSKMEYIEAGLRDLAQQVVSLGIRSIAIPPLGCGLGGLNWQEVKPKIEEAFQALPDVRVLVFEPTGAPAQKEMAKGKVKPAMTEGRAALLGLMKRYLDGLMDPFVSLLEVHKLMYFLQVAGEPLRLKYRKAHYGPYAENLRHVLNLMEGHFLQGYEDGGDSPEKQLEILPGAIEQAQVFLEMNPGTQARSEQVARLLSGFESPFGLELLSTVHWVAREEGASSVEEAIQKTHAWSSRKAQFEGEQIRIAWTILKDQGWLEPLTLAPSAPQVGGVPNPVTPAE